jgi:hypothetical protein
MLLMSSIWPCRDTSSFIALQDRYPPTYLPILQSSSKSIHIFIMDQQSIMEEMTNLTERRKGCWRIQDCSNCLRSKSQCGWCPNSATCVPASSILSPISSPVCPLASERYELRTSTLGCGCSTTTLVSIVITVLCTLAALLLLSFILWLLKWWGRTFRSGGWEIVVEEDGRVRQGTWRRGRWWPRWMVARR